ncbi:MAG: T9SS type A sorting domain-containing protein [Flavobacteriales bacterium]
MSSSKTDVLCHNDSNGTANLSEMMGGFAPVSFVFDTNAPIIFEHLKNDTYNGIKQGAGAAQAVAYGVEGASTSIGDVYIATGMFVDSVRFDSITLHNLNAGGRGMWIACFNSTTNDLIWANSAIESTGEWIYGLDLEAVGDKVFVVGYLAGNTVFGSDTVMAGSNYYQAYIAKYDIPTGNLETVVQFGETGDDGFYNIRAGADNRLYVTGYFTDSISFGGTTFFTAGGYDVSVACFDTALAINYWANTAGGSGTDIAQDIVPSSASPVTSAYVVGYFQSPGATFGSSSITSAGSYDYFISKIDSSGNWIWAKSGGGTGGNDNALAIDINSAGDRLYVGGIWSGTMTYDGQAFVSNGSRDGYILYLDTAGGLDSLYQFGGIGVDGIYDLQSVNNDFIVFAGARSGSWSFADSSFVANGVADAFVGMLGEDQLEIWGKNIGGSAGSGDEYNSVYCGPDSRLHCAGYFSGDASSYQSGLIASGTSDALITNDEFLGSIPDQFYSGLGAGDYLVSLNDAVGNSIIDTLAIGNPDSFSILGSTISASTSTSNDGSITVSVSGGTPDYDYTWSNGDTTLSIDSVMAGTYTITVVDANGCSSSEEFVVDTLDLLKLSFVTGDVTCQSTDNGSVSLTISGGVLPYSILWNTGDTIEDLTGLASGTYTVTVSDSGAVQTLTESISVSSNPIHPDPTVGPITGAISVESFEEFSYSVPSTQGSAFLWSSKGGEVTASASNASSILWHAGPDGVVRVQETDINGCVGMDSLEVNILFVGIYETPTKGVTIYPNPTSGILVVTLPFIDEQTFIKVVDQLGRTISDTRALGLTNEIDLRQCHPGIYTISIASTNGLSQSLKVIRL